MSGKPNDRIVKGKVTLTRRIWALIEDAAKAAGVSTPNVVQGSYSNGSASAGTHSGGGAFDLSVKGLGIKKILALLTELRKRNCAAWFRAPAYGWTSTGPHIHAVVKDEPDLSKSARQQVEAYDKGLNGLVSKRKDPFARPAQHVFTIRKAAVQVASKDRNNVLLNLAVRDDPDLPPIEVLANRYVELGRIDLPAGSRFEPSAAIRLPGGCWATWKFVRVGWGADPDGLDETGCQPLYARPDGKPVSHTPKGHIMKGGGPLSYQICVFAPTDKVSLPTVKLMLNKVEAG